jgi:hypothetical protein
MCRKTLTSKWVLPVVGLAVAIVCCSAPAWADEEARSSSESASASREDTSAEAGTGEAEPRWPAERLRGERPLRDALRERLERQGRPPRGPANRPGPAAERNPAEHRAAALAVLGDINPRLAERVQQAIRDNPERARIVLGRLGGRLDHLIQLRQDDPEMYKLRVRDQRSTLHTVALVRRLREAQRSGEQAQVAALSDRLREHLTEHFEVRQRIRERELHNLEKRIEQLRAELDDHRERKQALIDQYVERARTDQRIEAEDADLSEDEPTTDAPAKRPPESKRGPERQ